MKRLFGPEKKFTIDGRPTVMEIAVLICERMKRPLFDVLSERRTWKISSARQLIFAVAREFGYSHHDIARAVGHRSHSTIVTAVQRELKFWGRSRVHRVLDCYKHRNPRIMRGFQSGRWYQEHPENPRGNSPRPYRSHIHALDRRARDAGT